MKELSGTAWVLELELSTLPTSIVIGQTSKNVCLATLIAHSLPDDINIMIFFFLAARKCMHTCHLVYNKYAVVKACHRAEVRVTA